MILFGVPGAGKGTFGRLLGNDFGALKVSPGDLFRKVLKSEGESPIKALLESAVSQGRLVDDATTWRAVKGHLADNAGQSRLIFDGVPRNTGQAETLQAEFDLRRFVLVNILLEDSVLVEKLTGRRVCNCCGRNYNLCCIKRDGYDMDPLLPAKEGECDDCKGCLVQRKDDTEEVIKGRLELYEKETQPVMKILEQAGVKKIDFSPKKGVKDYPELKRRLEPILKELEIKN